MNVTICFVADMLKTYEIASPKPNQFFVKLLSEYIQQYGSYWEDNSILLFIETKAFIPWYPKTCSLKCLFLCDQTQDFSGWNKDSKVAYEFDPKSLFTNIPAAMRLAYVLSVYGSNKILMYRTVRGLREAEQADMTSMTDGKIVQWLFDKYKTDQDVTKFLKVKRADSCFCFVTIMFN